MSKLFVFLYDNDFNKGCNVENLRLNFLRDSGLEPEIILDQPTRTELIDCLLALNESEDDILIHFVSHGGERGICKIYPDIPGNVGDLSTLIEWSTFIEYLNIISNKCQKLRVNLGNVCNSYHILELQNMINFDVLFANTTVMNTVAPRKYNKLLLDEITAGVINGIYSIYRN